MTDILLFAHILLFVFSFAFTAGTGMVGGRVARSGDARTIQTYFRAVRPFSMAGGIGWLLTALTGGALAHAYGIDMAAPWLLGSYAAFAVLIAVGFGLHSPWQARVIAAQPGPELDGLLNAPSHKLASALSAISILVLVFLMVVRPA